MALVHKIACDNPDCRQIGEPEHYETNKDGSIKAKSLRPPYGWWLVQAGCQGPGPYVKLMTCSVECVTPALEHADHNYRLMG
jgi:hypothetical protein